MATGSNCEPHYLHLSHMLVLTTIMSLKLRILLFVFFKTVSHYIALAVLKLTVTSCLCLPCAQIKGVCHHAKLILLFYIKVLNCQFSCLSLLGAGIAGMSHHTPLVYLVCCFILFSIEDQTVGFVKYLG